MKRCKHCRKEKEMFVTAENFTVFLLNLIANFVLVVKVQDCVIKTHLFQLENEAAKRVYL